MSQQTNKVEELTKKLAGDKLDAVLATAEALEQTGKTRNRALADALEFYSLGGSVGE